mmetsp:Transcript_9366/g.14124  ORF Transcript_9366/g.14124 Transcript_9366/m.14124 type:complete len:565 (+) Transcript_9366:198-1892(+)|eukprot:CAMPEP_0185038902 /NCGR_PEP_ID=MMETSP1103-20130426/35154_1 /TAXON_ID=36769 /ORGANISM="Paraphysomonas bandaiensis, Strain Caron Lab Isolate" /LENGTH=564 /DNA_ID=CAMNT_0027577555 /DNA_START=124 /DNA_END=1818 /DNA_ORIENTATION=+
MQRKTRQSKRRDQRRKVAYMVKKDAISRSSMTNTELIEFCSAISKNNISFFGISKMSAYTLEQLFHDPESGDEHTLMTYCNMHGRDVIMSALIRAGCDPSVHPSHPTRAQCDVNRHLLDLPTGYPVWLVRWLYGLIAASIQNDYRAYSCVVCSSTTSLLLKWRMCEHLVCYDCSWEALCRPPISTRHSLRCPQCDCRCDDGTDDFYLSSGATFGSIYTSPRCRKQASYEAWSALPVTTPAKCPKRPPIAALPLHLLSRRLLGSVQSQRTDELHRAAVSGDTYRLYWLLIDGVHLDDTNEYGQTALFLAAMTGQAESVKFLLWAGANVDVKDNSQCTAAEAAFCRNHLSVMDLLDSINESDRKEKHLPLPITLPPAGPSVTVLIPPGPHPGAGSYQIDGCFSDSFLSRLEYMWSKCPETPATKPSCSSRFYLCDSRGEILTAFCEALSAAREVSGSEDEFDLSGVFPNMRFLCYSTYGGSLPPHEDISHTDPFTNLSSTHTFILYLSTCEFGGETVLLDSVKKDSDFRIAVSPVRGRLLLFPHRCPHEGAGVISLPKLLLRGEAY